MCELNGMKTAIVSTENENIIAHNSCNGMNINENNTNCWISCYCPYQNVIDCQNLNNWFWFDSNITQNITSFNSFVCRRCFFFCSYFSL